jgi:hypothetical protein
LDLLEIPPARRQASAFLDLRVVEIGARLEFGIGVRQPHGGLAYVELAGYVGDEAGAEFAEEGDFDESFIRGYGFNPSITPAPPVRP